jgi:CHAD domain-containing protein
VLDTFDALLFDDGVRLVRRASTLVLTGDDGSTASLQLDGALRVADDLPPGPFRERIADIIDVRALLPVATVTTTSQRLERRNADGKLVAVVDVHHDATVDEVCVDRWLAEVVELAGYAKHADEARRLVSAHVVEPEDVDAVDRLLTAAGVDRDGHHIEPGVPLDPAQPAVEGFRAALVNLADAIEINQPGTIDDIDPEFLHDLRVAVRRSRSLLRHARKVMPPELLAWAEPALKAVGALTGPPRDLDVQVLGWRGQVAALGAGDIEALEPLRRQLVADRDRAHERLAAELRAGEAARHLERWSAAIREPIDPERAGPHGGEPLVDVVRSRVRSAQRRLLDHGRAIHPDTPADHVHEVRKDAKKLRYLLECFADLFPADERKQFVKRLKRLQELLGDHQDAEVQAAELRSAAGAMPPMTPPETLVAIGRLVEQLEDTRHRTRDGFAERFAEYDSKATRRSLKAVLDGAGS